MTNFSGILRNPHFCNLAAVVRYPFGSHNWKKQHPSTPFWTLWRNLNLVTPLEGKWNKAEVLGAFTALLVQLSEADDKLWYTEDDIAWLVSVLDDEELCKVTISMWKAAASAPDEFLTPQEVAELTGTHESGWRNKAAAGEVRGAFKKGTTWLLPRSVLQSQGIDI